MSRKRPFSAVDGGSSLLPPNWLKDCRADVDLTDVTLRCGEREFKAHRFVLAHQSPMFRSMLYGSYKEALDGQVSVEITDAETFERLLEAVYSHDYDDGALKTPTDLSPAPSPRSDTAPSTPAATASPATAAAAAATIDPVVLEEQQEAAIIDIRVYAAADYYQIAHIGPLARRKFMRALLAWYSVALQTQSPLRAGLLAMATAIADTIPEEKAGPLREILADFVPRVWGRLRSDNDGAVAALAGVRADFAVAIMTALEASSARARAHCARVEAARAEQQRQREALEREIGFFQLCCTFCGKAF